MNRILNSTPQLTVVCFLAIFFSACTEQTLINENNTASDVAANGSASSGSTPKVLNISDVSTESSVGGSTANTDSGGTPVNNKSPVAGTITEQFDCQDRGPEALKKDIRRLTRDELSTSIIELFGENIRESIDLKLATLPSDEYNLAAHKTPLTMNSEFFDGLFSTIDGLSILVQSDGDVSAYANCATDLQSMSSSCLTTLLSNLGLRMFNRPLSTDELEHFSKIYLDQETDRFAIMLGAMLLSPDFLFHVETGTGSGNTIALNQFEIANRLSFMALGTPPNAALLAKAANGSLTRESLHQEVEQLLRSPAGKSHVFNFFKTWLHISETQKIIVPDQFLDGLDADTYVKESIAELEKFVEYIVYEKKGTIADLLTSKAIFPHTDQLASVFKSGLWSEGNSPLVDTNLSRGLLLRAPSLISGKVETSPIHRGVFLLDDVLCREVAFPGNEIISLRTDDDLSGNARTVREHVEELTSPDLCMSCHADINAMGFALEDMDALGRFRSEEMYFIGNEYQTSYAVDAFVDSLSLNGKTKQVAGSGALMAEFAISNEVAICLTKKFFRFTQMRPDTSDNADQCHMNSMLSAASKSNGSILDMLINAIVTSIDTRQI